MLACHFPYRGDSGNHDRFNRLSWMGSTVRFRISARGRGAAKLIELVLSEEQTLSPEKAASLLGVSRPMVVRWINEGLLEDRKTGSHHKIPLASVLSLKAARAEAGRKAVALVADAETDPAAARRTAPARDRARTRVARRDGHR